MCICTQWQMTRLGSEKKTFHFLTFSLPNFSLNFSLPDFSLFEFPLRWRGNRINLSSSHQHDHVYPSTPSLGVKKVLENDLCSTYLPYLDISGFSVLFPSPSAEVARVCFCLWTFQLILHSIVLVSHFSDSPVWETHTGYLFYASYAFHSIIFFIIIMNR